jgi:hypothetical protein
VQLRLVSEEKEKLEAIRRQLEMEVQELKVKLQKEEEKTQQVRRTIIFFFFTAP